MQARLIPADQTGPSIPIHPVRPDGLSALLDTLPTEAAAFCRAQGFDAAAGSFVVLPDRSGAVAVVLYGLSKTGGDQSPLLPAKLAGGLPPGDYHFEGTLAADELAALAWGLAGYRYRRYRGGSDEKPAARLRLSPTLNHARIAGQVDAIGFVRDLVNTPANDLGPAELAAAARSVAEAAGSEVHETVGEALIEAGFPLVHAVGAASDRAPRLVDFTWGDPSAPKVTLVGKGVCFDTGGLDIKSDTGMLIMKKDMGGAANVLGLARLIMEARLPVRLRVLIPAVENAISGRAFRPGDVFRSRKGLTVEIGNTDAEGRLILADALALADEESPDLLIDMATLTGAARVALGPELPPFYTDDDALAGEIAEAATKVHDPVWRLPLWRPYAAMIESKIADVNNAGSGGFAGSITAALFLQKFVEKARSWVHFDIYAWNPSAKPGRTEGGEAQAIRTLFAVIEKRYGG